MFRKVLQLRRGFGDTPGHSLLLSAQHRYCSMGAVRASQHQQPRTCQWCSAACSGKGKPGSLLFCLGSKKKSSATFAFATHNAVRPFLLARTACSQMFLIFISLILRECESGTAARSILMGKLSNAIFIVCFSTEHILKIFLIVSHHVGHEQVRVRVGKGEQ